MRCDLCNGTISVIIGSINFNSKALGHILVPGIKHSKCRDCGDISIEFTETKKAHEYITKKETDAIYNLPIGDFLSLNAAAEILGISKQAFSKHSRIRRGFIYSVTIDNKKLYYKKSVDEFKRTGKDGRILLTPKHQDIYRQKRTHTSYIENIIPHDKPIYNKLEIYQARNPMKIFTTCSNQKHSSGFYCATTH